MTVYNPTPTLNPAAVTPDYHTLKALIATIQDSGPAEQVLPLLVQVLGHPVLLSAMLRRIAGDAQWLSRVEKASYYHRNGFDKIVLLETETFKLRLHHFRPQPNTLPAENIHDHRWPFASAIVSGRLRMHLYEPSLTGKFPVQEYCYHSTKENGRYRCDKIGKNNLALVAEKVYGPGASYFMPTTTLHRIVYKPGEEALTLVLTGKPERNTCKLFATGILQDEDMELQPYSPRHLENKLQMLANQLNPSCTINH